MTMEHKFLTPDFEVAEDGTLEGYGSMFGEVDQGGDIVVKGAFLKSLNARTPKMLWQHDAAQPIGRWDMATEDSKGLVLRGKINMDVQRGREARALIRDGAIDGLSIGYRTRDAVKTKQGRELRDVNLLEVSLVTFPMLESATVSGVKSWDDLADAEMAEKKNFLEEALRKLGLSGMQAKHGASVLAKDVLGERDAPDAAAVMADIRQIVRGL